MSSTREGSCPSPDSTVRANATRVAAFSATDSAINAHTARRSPRRSRDHSVSAINPPNTGPSTHTNCIGVVGRMQAIHAAKSTDADAKPIQAIRLSRPRPSASTDAAVASVNTAPSIFAGMSLHSRTCCPITAGPVNM